MSSLFLKKESIVFFILKYLASYSRTIVFNTIKNETLMAHSLTIDMIQIEIA